MNTKCKNKGIFFTSDWHVGHENILKFCNRPFKDVDEMDSVLIKNYNSVVGFNDLCYFLGDMGRGNRVKDVLSQLNGTKVLIVGNHDSKSYNWHYSVGFDVVMNSFSLIIAGDLMTFSHYPLIGVYRENTEGMRGSQPGDNWHKEFKYKEIAIIDRGQSHGHGHIHSPNDGKSKRIEGLQLDLGVDANEYRPVAKKRVEGFVNKLKQRN